MAPAAADTTAGPVQDDGAVTGAAGAGPLPRSSGRRVRRPSDVGRLVAAVTGLVLIVLATVRAPDAVGSVVHAVPTVDRDPVRAVVSVASVVASLAVLGVLLTVAVDAARNRRTALLQALAALALGLVLGAAGGRGGDAAGGSVGNLLTGPRDDAALVPVVVSVAFLAGADLQRRRRWGQPSRWAVVGALVCAVALGTLTVTGAVAAVLLGAVAGLAVRVAAGVPPARPADDVIRAELGRAGVRVGGLQVVEQAAGYLRLTGEDADGTVRVTVVDPDGRGVPFARRAGRVLRFRTAVVGRPALTQRGGLERQASSAALAA